MLQPWRAVSTGAGAAARRCALTHQYGLAHVRHMRVARRKPQVEQASATGRSRLGMAAEMGLVHWDSPVSA